MLNWSGDEPEAYLALLACAPALALAIDRVLGEPAARWHPVTWMRRYLDWADARLTPRTERAYVATGAQVLARGAVAWSAAAAVVLALAWLLQTWVLAQPVWLATLALGLFLKPLLAWARVHDDTLAVERGLAEAPGAAQAQEARPVGHDAAPGSAHELREGAIQRLATNLSDSLVAPLFWFALLGLPGAALFRFAHTAAATWGRRGARSPDGVVRGGTAAGLWAVRAADALAWLPARLTAALIVGLGGPAALRGLPRLPAEAARLPSTHAGWPVATMALALGVQLGRPSVHALNAGARTPEPADTLRACAIGSRCAMAATLLACAVLLLTLSA